MSYLLIKNLFQREKFCKKFIKKKQKNIFSEFFWVVFWVFWVCFFGWVFIASPDLYGVKKI
jgi:hypothetical protein